MCKGGESFAYPGLKPALRAHCGKKVCGEAPVGKEMSRAQPETRALVGGHLLTLLVRIPYLESFPATARELQRNVSGTGVIYKHFLLYVKD